MRRPTLNFLVDALAFGAFVLLTTTGVLMHYVLPPGSGRFTSVWGLDRHAWGSLHFWIAVSFFGILSAHLGLHWRWIASTVRGRQREGSGMRVALGLIGLLTLLALAVAPLLTAVEKVERPRRGKLSTPELAGPHDGPRGPRMDRGYGTGVRPE
jgi:hypothetical protein